MPPTSYSDDPSIPDAAELWRLVPPNWQVPDGMGGLRPSSAAFQDSKDGTPMSVFLADQVRASGRGLKDVLSTFPGYMIASFSAGFARTLGLSIARDPTPQEPAHAVVVGKKTKWVRNQFVLKSSLIDP